MRLEHRVVTYTTEHAWSGSTNLQMVLADLCSVEHCVEASDFIDLHRGHLENFGSLVHGWERQEVVILLLGNEQDWDAGRGFIVVWVLRQQRLNRGVALLRELEGTLLKVVLCIAMVCKGTKVLALEGSHESWLQKFLRLRTSKFIEHHLGQHVCLLLL